MVLELGFLTSPSLSQQSNPTHIHPIHNLPIPKQNPHSSICIHKSSVLTSELEIVFDFSKAFNFLNQPTMGDVDPCVSDPKLKEGLDPSSRYYFHHSKTIPPPNFAPNYWMTKIWQHGAGPWKLLFLLIRNWDLSMKNSKSLPNLLISMTSTYGKEPTICWFHGFLALFHHETCWVVDKIIHFKSISIQLLSKQVIYLATTIYFRKTFLFT